MTLAIAAAMIAGYAGASRYFDRWSYKQLTKIRDEAR